MDFDTIRPFLSGLIGGTIVMLLAVSMRRTKPVQVAGSFVLRYPRALGYFGLIVGGILGAFAVRNALYGSAVNSYAVALTVPSILSLIGFYLAAEVFVSRVVLNDEGVIVVSVFGTRETTWRDITRIEFVPAGSWYVIHTRGGKRLRVSAMLSGITMLQKQAAKFGIVVHGEPEFP